MFQINPLHDHERKQKGGQGGRNISEIRVWLSTECLAISHSSMLLLEDFNVTRLTATDDLLSLRSLIKTGMQSMFGDKRYILFFAVPEGAQSHN